MKRIALAAMLSAIFSTSAFAQTPQPSTMPAPQAAVPQAVAPQTVQPTAVAPAAQPPAPAAQTSFQDDEDKRTLREISKMQIDLKLKAMVKESKKLDYEIDEIERKANPVVQAQAIPEDPQFLLTGVYGQNNDLRAEIKMPSGGRFTVAEQSSLPDGFFVKKITSNSMVVTKGQKGKKDYTVWMVGAAKGTETPAAQQSLNPNSFRGQSLPVPAAAVSFPGAAR